MYVVDRVEIRLSKVGVFRGSPVVVSSYYISLLDSFRSTYAKTYTSHTFDLKLDVITR
jgi:hypothetical protein